MSPSDGSSHAFPCPQPQTAKQELQRNPVFQLPFHLDSPDKLAIIMIPAFLILLLVYVTFWKNIGPTTFIMGLIIRLEMGRADTERRKKLARHAGHVGPVLNSDPEKIADRRGENQRISDVQNSAQPRQPLAGIFDARVPFDE